MSLLLPPNSTFSLQFRSICNPPRLLKAKLPVCIAFKWFPMHHHPIKVAIHVAISTTKEMPEHHRFQTGNLNILTLWFTLLWVSGSSYYQHYTVSVSYQPYPSFRQNAGELKAGRITYKDKGRRATVQDWQKLALGGLN